ncbi:hypothetical protein DJ018_03335 [Phenylobacterium deserti]|uniref:histidine kinase n=1 Tax=Phenylobacterium deserti TaxID=1914756 RepID=A0A328AQZ5_9CAUL|nr:hypothetical protein DJ018_03335 [Phenylobacterium deserti]
MTPTIEPPVGDIFQEMFQELGQILWLLTPEGGIRQFNAAWSAYTGLPTEMPALSWADVFHPDDRQRLIEARTRGIQAGSQYEVEARMRRFDGVYRRHLCRVKPLLKDEQIYAWLGTAMDVEEFRQSQDERERVSQGLAESETRFRNLVEATPGFLFISDAEGRNTFTNEVFQRYCGVAAADLLGHGWISFLHPDDHVRAASEWRKAVSAGSRYQQEYRFKSASGEYRWFVCNGVPHRNDAGEIVQWTGVATDIHDRKLLEEQLARGRDLLAAVLETSPDPIFAKAPDGTYLFANTATAKALGRSEKGVTGLKDSEVIAPHLLAGVRAHDSRVLGGETITEEEIVEDLGVATKTYLVTKAPMRVGDGAVAGVVAVARDITERKEQDRHRELLINELNHRVKNTLAIVQNMARQSLRQLNTSARSAFDGRLIALAAAHDVLTRHSWQAAFMDEIVESALNPFVDAARPERLRSQGPRMRLESQHAVALSLALHELATNAVKHGALSVDEGSVDVHWWLTRSDDGPEMKLLWTERGGPKVTPPSKLGFGSRLIERGVAQDLRGKAKIEYLESGLLCEIRMPLPYGRPEASAHS